MVMQELKNFKEKVSSDITKITQACTAAQEKTWKVIVNAIPQALTKSHDVTPPNPTIDSRNFGTKHTSNSSYESKWTLSWPTNNFSMPQQSNDDVYHSQGP